MGVCWLAVLSLSGTPQIEEWGPSRDGVVTRLVVVSKDHKIGEPIKLSCELKNTSTEERAYFPITYSGNYPFTVRGPDGEAVHYIGSFGQTGFFNPPELSPGQIKTQFTNHDLTQQYLIDKPGKYVISISESNKVTVLVADAPVPDKTKFMRKMIKQLPKKWDLVFHSPNINLVSDPNNFISDIRWFSIIFTDRKDSPKDNAEYLDETTMGHVWITMSQPDIVKRWPQYKTVIQEQLKPFKK
jgi:hypothetical protein